MNLKEQIGVGGVYFDSVNEVASRINANDYVPNGALRIKLYGSKTERKKRENRKTEIQNG